MVVEIDFQKLIDEQKMSSNRQIYCPMYAIYITNARKQLRDFATDKESTAIIWDMHEQLSQNPLID